MAQHFERVLNVICHINWAAVHAVLDSVVPPPALWTPPSLDAVEETIKRLNNRSAPGPDGAPPELYKHSSVRRTVAEILHPHVCAWWNGASESPLATGTTPTWLRSTCARGDMADLGNWRGVCLLPVLSKVMATLVKDSLRSPAENVLAQSQVGFRRCRGCADATYVLSRLMEEIRLTTPPFHLASLHTLLGSTCFSLTFARPSTARLARSYGRFSRILGCLPAGLVRCVRDMRGGVKSKITYCGHLSAEFDMATGVRQGAVEAPTLWDQYYHYVVLDWKQRLGADSGLDVAFLEDTDLFRARAGVLGSQDAQQMNISELAYADDLATLHLSWSELCRAAQLLSDTVRDWGGELHVGKTKWMCVQSALLPTGAVDLELFVGGNKVEQVNEFEYLGSVLANDADLGQRVNVRRRLRQASKTFASFRGLWRSRRITLSTKRPVFLAVVKSILLWGAESWALHRVAVRLLRRSWYGWIRTSLGLTWRQCADEHISWQQLRNRLGVKDILAYFGWVMYAACLSVVTLVFCLTALYEAVDLLVYYSNAVARGGLL